MRILLQRVNFAKVTVEGEIVGDISKGILVYLGVSEEDTQDKIDWAVNKISSIRLWPSSEKGFDLNVFDAKGEVLIVSQFTLEGDMSKGSKPNFASAASYDKAKEFYEKVISGCKEKGIDVATGMFGADMKVESENDGPATIILEK